MKEQEIIPREERLVRVLYGLVDVETGQRVGRSIADTILAKPSIRRVIVIGEPGVHKSTMIENLAYELKRRGKISSQLVFYDDLLAETENELGSREGWGDEDWHKLSKNILKAIGPISAIQQDPRQVQIIEIMGMSKEGGKDRAVTALQTLANEVREESPTELSTLFVAIAPTHKGQQKTMMIRRSIQHVSDAEVFDFLDNQFNMFYIGAHTLAKRLSQQTGKSPSYYMELFGRNIKARFSKMGAEDKILQIHREILEGARGLIQEPALAAQARILKIAPSSYDIGELEQNTERVVAYHLLHKVRVELGLDEKHAYIVFSTFLDGRIFYNVNEEDFQQVENS